MQSLEGTEDSNLDAPKECTCRLISHIAKEMPFNLTFDDETKIASYMSGLQSTDLGLRVTDMRSSRGSLDGVELTESKRPLPVR
jgi:hypothetical protein